MRRLICILLCVLTTAFALCSCGRSADSSSAGSAVQEVPTQAQKVLKKADLGWLRFDIPEDFRLDDNKYTEASLVKNGDSSCKLNFFVKGFSKVIDMDTVISDTLTENGGTLEETFEMGGRKWYPINNGLMRYYTQADEEHILYVAAFDLTKDDEAFKTVFESLEIDYSQYGTGSGNTAD